jgi:3-dehydroquinate synthase
MGLFAASPGALFGALEETHVAGGQDSLWAATDLLARRGALAAVEAADGAWADIDTPAALIRAEIRLRHERRVGSIIPPQIAATRGADETFDFVAGKVETTKMVMVRGYFRDPGAFEIIPRESASSPVFLFTDETVDALYAAGLSRRLKAMGYNIHLIVMPDGEGSKSLSRYVQLTERVLSLGVDEQSVFVSVGGGVVCNVCGFIASTIYRGLNLIHLPTSLMAQCDAAISHKQAINGQSGKNMVGSYYSPRTVLVDVETLTTLEPRLIHDGLAEVIKHALCQDPAYVDYLMGYRGDCVRDLDFLEQVIRRNIRLKCELSVDDPKELAHGAVLQYGHTLGHPVEHLSGYTLYHGESVAIGMVIAARVARILRACGDDLVALHEEIVSRFGLPRRIPRGIPARDVVEACRYNKRYLTEGTRMALLEAVGRPWTVSGQYVVPVANEVLLEAIGQTMEE